MTPEEQRIAIAEACGWKWMPPFNGRKKANYLVPPTGQSCTVWRDGTLGGNRPPDYPNDLNAMNEVEKVLKAIPHDGGIFTPWERYARTLVSELGTLDALHATAAQRSEVFLYTIGKWKD